MLGPDGGGDLFAEPFAFGVLPLAECSLLFFSESPGFERLTGGPWTRATKWRCTLAAIAESREFISRRALAPVCVVGVERNRGLAPAGSVRCVACQFATRSAYPA